MAKPGEKLEVEILHVDEVTTYPALNQPAVTRIITYRYGDMPPGTVFIPAKEDTPENRAKVIREDIEKRSKHKPEKITV